jgi:hypothetical protein
VDVTHRRFDVIVPGHVLQRKGVGVPPAAKKATFAAYFQRIAAHKGSKRAIVAVSHALLVVCYYLLKRKCHFQDLGVNYFDQLNHERLQQQPRFVSGELS